MFGVFDGVETETSVVREAAVGGVEGLLRGWWTEGFDWVCVDL